MGCPWLCALDRCARRRSPAGERLISKGTLDDPGSCGTPLGRGHAGRRFSQDASELTLAL